VLFPKQIPDLKQYLNVGRRDRLVDLFAAWAIPHPLLPPGSGHLNPFREQALTKSAGRAERQVRSLGMRPAIHAGGVHCEPSGLRNLSPMSRVTLRWWYTRWMTSARSCGYSCPAVTSSCPR
jgi:hypothetical protein